MVIKSSLNTSVFLRLEQAGEITVVVDKRKTLSELFFHTLWPNDRSPGDHCASNDGRMPNKNHSDDKCDVKRSFPRFLLQIFSSEKFLPPQSDSGSVPRSDRVTNTGGRGPDTCLDTQPPPFSIARLRHRDSGAEEVTLANLSTKHISLSLSLVSKFLQGFSWKFATLDIHFLSQINCHIKTSKQQQAIKR